MMYPYITLADETLITHSHLLGNGENKYIEVHFERPRDYGFDMARCTLPSYKWTIKQGYSDKEIEHFEKIVKNGVHLFFKYAANGGLSVAKSV